MHNSKHTDHYSSKKIPSHEKTTSGKLMPLLFLSAPGIGTRYSDSYSEHLPAVVRPRKREAIITYKKIRPMIQLDNLSYRLISPYNDKGVFSLMLYTPQKKHAVFLPTRFSIIAIRLFPVSAWTG